MNYAQAEAAAQAADDRGFVALLWSSYGTPFSGTHHVQFLVHPPRGHRFESSDFLSYYGAPAFTVEPWEEEDEEAEAARWEARYDAHVNA